VERAEEHYMTRLRREWQLAAKAAAARAAAAAAADEAAASAAAPAVAAAARQAITLQLQESTLLIQSRCTDKVRAHLRVTPCAPCMLCRACVRPRPLTSPACAVWHAVCCST
jgi:hypothetical protein